MDNSEARLRDHLDTVDHLMPKDLPPGMISDMKIRLAFHMMLDENLRALSEQLTTLNNFLRGRECEK